MSGVFGLLYLDGRPVNDGVLEPMGEALKHRGPHGVGFWAKGSVGFGHCMLHTTEESLFEQLPLEHSSGELVITADARLDNRAELVLALGLTSAQAAEMADSAFILAAYARWGTRCLDKLLGDWAFALWDARKRTLFCARDLFGIKPFYYYYRPGSLFAFASEIKGLFGLAGVPRRLNEVRIADYLVALFEDRSITLYQDIHCLPPAHALILHVDGPQALQIERYWALDPTRELKLSSDEEYAQAFLSLFEEAVRCRLRGAFPVGSMLSGGLDSSSITCMARDLLAAEGSGPLPTFSAIFPGLPENERKPCDERPYMHAVVAMGGVDAHYVHADEIGPLADIDRVLWHEEEGLIGPNFYMHWALFEAAQRRRVRILLDGTDGDGVISHGLETFSELARRGRWRKLYLEARAFAERRRISTKEMVWQYGFRPLAPEWAVHIWRKMRGRPTTCYGDGSLIRPDFARRIGIEERYRALASPPARTAREAHIQGLNSGLYQILLQMVDRAAAAFAIEPRYPFFDRRLVEFCVAIPAEQKLAQGWTRMILRRAMAGVLPPKVQWRLGKANLSPGFRRGLLTHGEPLLEQIILGDDPGPIAEYVHLPEWRATYRRFIAHPMEEADLAVSHMFLAVPLALWLRRMELAV
ncbi:MAG: lasso peptide isopeptide bond-forming cyclase [Chloroflexi bacterium]|nr:lasso peptide isopeptide bond-forming cyclase [Chloroflexota bacterium]